MFKNYLKISLRNIKKHKGYSFINITGLTIGMTCTILILLWVQDELSYDKYHEHAAALYRVVVEHHFTGGDILTSTYSPPPLASALKDEVPEIVNTARFKNIWRKYRVAYGEKLFNETKLSIADQSFLEMFSFTFIKGDPSTALSDPFSIILTEEMAEKYFGKEEPLGKTINFDIKYDFTVTGIIENIPKNSHIQFDFLVPFNFVKELWPDMRLDVWWNNTFKTYVLCQNNISTKNLNRNIRGFIKAHWDQSVTDIFLQPLSRIHLYSITGIGGSIRYVKNFSIIALFVLLIACINFMNLSTARSANRAKEVGLRKVVGAFRNQLTIQFLGESFILTLISMILAIILVKILLPAFNNFSAKEIVLEFYNFKIILGLVSITVITGIISGCYPALYLSSFSPVSVLKGTLKTGAKSSMFRKILVIIQFSLSIILIICTIIVYRQLDYIQNKDLGLEKDHLLYMEIRGDFVQKYETLKNELSRNPNILKITAANEMPISIQNATSGIGWDGKDPDATINMGYTHVDFNYFETFKMEMVEGRTFSKEFSTDTLNYILNEKAASLLGKESVIDERFNMWGQNGKIIGVVKDFNFNHFSNEIKPLILTITPRFFSTIVIRIGSENIPNTIKNIEAVWNKFIPKYPFEYKFFDDDFDKLYRSEQRMGGLFTCFTILAIFISCLGLFSLASFMVEQRTKEIGVRKVLGASVTGIVFLLSKEFTKWVLMANIIAWPISYYAMYSWLQDFAYRMSIDLWPFIFSAVLALIIALLTVNYQSVRAALANPVEALKYE